MATSIYTTAPLLPSLAEQRETLLRLRREIASEIQRSIAILSAYYPQTHWAAGNTDDQEENPDDEGVEDLA